MLLCKKMVMYHNSIDAVLILRLLPNVRLFQNQLIVSCLFPTQEDEGNHEKIFSWPEYFLYQSCEWHSKRRHNSWRNEVFISPHARALICYGCSLCLLGWRALPMDFLLFLAYVRHYAGLRRWQTGNPMNRPLMSDSDSIRMSCTSLPIYWNPIKIMSVK